VPAPRWGEHATVIICGQHPRFILFRDSKMTDTCAPVDSASGRQNIYANYLLQCTAIKRNRNGQGDEGASEIKRGYGSDQRPLARVLWDARHMIRGPALSAKGNFQPTIAMSVSADTGTGWAKARSRVMEILALCRREENPQSRRPHAAGCRPALVLIVRSAPDEFRASTTVACIAAPSFCSKLESAETIRCPYHAEWSVTAA